MEHSPLATLSPELRNAIYDLALFERRPVSISKHFDSEAPLLRTCRQIRTEAELFFYSTNDFIFTSTLRVHDFDVLLHWVKQGPKEKLSLIKSLCINLEHPGLIGRRHGPHDECPLIKIERLMEELEPVYNELHDCSFGDRKIEQVVKVQMHGFGDDHFPEDSFKFPIHSRLAAEVAGGVMIAVATGTHFGLISSAEDAAFYHACIRIVRTSRGKPGYAGDSDVGEGDAEDGDAEDGDAEGGDLESDAEDMPLH